MGPGVSWRCGIHGKLVPAGGRGVLITPAEGCHDPAFLGWCNDMRPFMLEAQPCVSRALHPSMRMPHVLLERRLRGAGRLAELAGERQTGRCCSRKFSAQARRHSCSACYSFIAQPGGPIMRNHGCPHACHMGGRRKSAAQSGC